MTAVVDISVAAECNISVAAVGEHGAEGASVSPLCQSREQHWPHRTKVSPSESSEFRITSQSESEMTSLCKNLIKICENVQFFTLISLLS